MRTDSPVIRALGELGLLIDRINSMGIAGAGKIRYSQDPIGSGRDLWRSSSPDAGVGLCWTNPLLTVSLGLCVTEFPSPASLLVHNYSSFVLCRDNEVDPLHSNYFYFLNSSPY